MEVKVDVAAVTDKNAVLGLDTVLLESIDLVEEVGDVDNAAGANEVNAALSQDARGCDNVSNPSDDPRNVV